MPLITEGDVELKLKQLDVLLSNLRQIRASLTDQVRLCEKIAAFQEDDVVSVKLLLPQLHESLELDVRTLDQIETSLRTFSA